MFSVLEDQDREGSELRLEDISGHLTSFEEFGFYSHCRKKILSNVKQ